LSSLFSLPVSLLLFFVPLVFYVPSFRFLSIYLSIYISIYLPTYIHTYIIHTSTYLPIYPPTYIHTSTYLPIYPPTYPHTYIHTCIPTYLSIYLSIYLSFFLSTKVVNYGILHVIVFLWSGSILLCHIFPHRHIPGSEFYQTEIPKLTIL